jgi:hypothetical protein
VSVADLRWRGASIRFSVTDSGLPVTDPARIVVSDGGGTCEGAPTGHTKLNTGEGHGSSLAYDNRRGQFSFDWKAPKQVGLCWFVRFSIDNATPLGPLVPTALAERLDSFRGAGTSRPREHEVTRERLFTASLGKGVT